MTEQLIENRYYGVSEAQEGVIQRIQTSLSFAILQRKPFASAIVGPQKVGKTSAVLAVERGLREELGLVASYEAVETTDPNLIYVKATPDLNRPVIYPTQFWSEVPIQDTNTFKKIAQGVQKSGGRVLLDVVNKKYPIGDPRNNSEAADELKRIFSTIYIEHLHARSEGYISYEKANMRGNALEIDLKDPKFERALENHKLRVQASLGRNFIEGRVYVSDSGELVTELVFIGDPDKMYGSPYGQNVTTQLPF